MQIKNKSVYYLVAVAIGLLAALFLNYLHFQHGYTSRQYMHIWLRFVYPLFVLSSFLMVYFFSVKKKSWPAVLFVSFYVSTLFVLPGGGELLPFEIIIMLVLWVPCVMAAYLGSFFGNKRLPKDSATRT